jgi:hypothetical protein
VASESFGKGAARDDGAKKILRQAAASAVRRKTVIEALPPSGADDQNVSGGSGVKHLRSQI